jgi:type I restriction enzyme S subunit
MTTLTTSKLSEVAILQSGGTPSKANQNFWGGAIPWLTPKDMNGYDGTTHDCVTDAAIGNGTKLAPAGAIFIAVRGMSLHKEIRIVRPPAPVTFNQDIKAIVPRSIDGDFLYFALTTHKPTLLGLVESAGHGTGVLPTDRLTNLPIPRFGAAEELRVGKIFRSIEDKINLSRRMNQTLEAMAGAIFKDWFVDFGPSRAKMEGGESYLAPETLAQFPDQFDNEGKPEGWRNFRLDELVEQSKGSVSPSDFPNESFEHYSLPAYDAGQSPALDLGSTIRSNKTPVAPGTVLLSKLNPETSRVWLPYPKEQRTQIASTEFLCFRPRGQVGTALVYCLLSSPAFKAMLEGMVTGTSKSHQRISPSALLSQTVLRAAPKLLTIFEMAVGPLLDQQLANRAQMRILTTTRDLLLPKLMSGEMRAKAAEKIEEAIGAA